MKISRQLYTFWSIIKHTCTCIYDSSVGFLQAHTLCNGEECVKILSQKPPCEFQPVAIGSLAKGEATPYSDLEFLFLLERRTTANEEYFEMLSITMYFVIGNLRETKLSYMAIEELQGWFDDQAKNGSKIDGLSPGAGNIPTGNGVNQKKNCFIITTEDLAAVYEEVLKNPKEEALRGDLTAMLTYTQPFYSTPHGGKLVEVFESQDCKNISQ